MTPAERIAQLEAHKLKLLLEKQAMRTAAELLRSITVLEPAVERVLHGIDQQETDDVDGWWETSAGARFGAIKKAEIMQTVRAGWKRRVNIAHDLCAYLLESLPDTDKRVNDLQTACTMIRAGSEPEALKCIEAAIMLSA